MKFRKKPVVIEAFQLPEYDDFRMEEFHEWCVEQGFTNFFSERDQTLVITTLEGDMRAEAGDWIIKGIAGEFYPCKPEIFEQTYEPVNRVVDI